MTFIRTSWCIRGKSAAPLTSNRMDGAALDRRDTTDRTWLATGQKSYMNGPTMPDNGGYLEAQMAALDAVRAAIDEYRPGSPFIVSTSRNKDIVPEVWRSLEDAGRVTLRYIEGGLVSGWALKRAGQ